MTVFVQCFANEVKVEEQKRSKSTFSFTSKKNGDKVRINSSVLPAIIVDMFSPNRANHC